MKKIPPSRLFSIIILLLVISFARSVYAIDGAIDQTFNSNGSGGQAAGFNSSVQVVQIQDDTNQLIVAGNFTTYNGTPVGGIVRLNDDGTIDQTFNSNGSGGQAAGFNGSVSNSDVEIDDGILVTGNFTQYDGIPVGHIVRLYPNGTLDTNFNQKIGTGFNNNTRGIVQETVAGSNYGKIIVGGVFTTINGSPAKFLARLNADGTPDASFNSAIGSIGFAGGSGGVQKIGFQSDGKIIVGGQFTTFNGHTVNRIVRLTADGGWDSSFTTGTGSNGSVYTLNVLPNDQILVGGALNTFNGVSTGFMFKLNANGTLDTSFNSGGSGASGEVDAIFVQPNGKIIVEGTGMTKYNGTTVNYLTRLNTDGTLDSTFNDGTGFVGGTGNGVHAANSIFRQNGNMVINGNFTSYNGTPVGYIVSLQADITNPIISAINLVSNNSNPAYAKNGDVVTLSFTSNHPLLSSVITLGDQSVTPSCTSSSGTSVNCTASITISPSVPTNDGLVNFSLTETTVGGTTGPITTTSNSSSVTVIRTTPTTPTLSIGSPTSDTTPSISGTCTTGDTVVVTLGGQTLTTSCSQGNYTVIPSLLSDNTYTIHFLQTDTAGNQSSTGSTTLVVDTTVPTVTIDSPVDHAIFGSQTISGSCESGLVVHISGSGFTPTGTTSCTSGSYTYPITVTSNMIINVSQTDLASNTGGTTISVSAVNPAPTLSGITISSTNINPSYAKLGDTINLSFTSNYPLTGSGVTLDGVPVTPVCSGSGPVTCTTSLVIDDTHPASDGLLSFSITGSTGGGSTGPLTTTHDGSSITVLRVEPNRPTVTAIPPTSNTTPTISGTCISGDMVNLQVSLQNHQQLCSGNAYAITLDSLTDGTYTVGVSQTDPAGNTSDDQVVRTLTVDTIAPQITITSPSRSTYLGNETISGTCEAGLNVSITGTGFTPSSGTTSCDNGIFNYSIQVLQDITITTNQIDSAGNRGTATISAIAIPLPSGGVSGGCSAENKTLGVCNYSPIIPSTSSQTLPTPSTQTTTCIPYLTQKISLDGYHYGKQVTQLINFLNTHEGEHLTNRLTYTKSVMLAVKRFQVKYTKDILAPSHTLIPSGIVGTQTLRKINMLMCNHL